MHNLKALRDELIEEAETYKGSIKGGDPEDVACLKCLLSAADHADAILDRHGIEDEQEKSGRRAMRYRSYGVDPYGRSYDDPAVGVEAVAEGSDSGRRRAAVGERVHPCLFAG